MIVESITRRNEDFDSNERGNILTLVSKLIFQYFRQNSHLLVSK